MTHPIPAQARSDLELFRANKRFYDAMWTDARLVQAERFNTWPLVRSLLAKSLSRVEVGPGLRPRLPIEGTHFVDISVPALARLRESGGIAVLSPISRLPFPDGVFDLVCALDIVEHVDDDDSALAELCRIADPGAALLLSLPLHPSRWSAFDEFVGHRRRYEPERLVAKLGAHGLSVERSAVYGMRPRSSRLVAFGMWWLTHEREKAMWWYNRVMMPLAVRFEKKLEFVHGLVDTAQVDEILLVCRKQSFVCAR